MKENSTSLKLEGFGHFLWRRILENPQKWPRMVEQELLNAHVNDNTFWAWSCGNGYHVTSSAKTSAQKKKKNLGMCRRLRSQGYFSRPFIDVWLNDTIAKLSSMLTDELTDSLGHCLTCSNTAALILHVSVLFLNTQSHKFSYFRFLRRSIKDRWAFLFFILLQTASRTEFVRSSSKQPLLHAKMRQHLTELDRIAGPLAIVSIRVQSKRLSDSSGNESCPVKLPFTFQLSRLRGRVNFGERCAS